MAPKKTILVLTLVLFAGLTAAQSSEVFENELPDPVWNNSEEDYSFEFTSDNFTLDQKKDWLKEESGSLDVVRENLSDLGEKSFVINSSSGDQDGYNFTLNVSDLRFSELSYSPDRPVLVGDSVEPEFDLQEVDDDGVVGSVEASDSDIDFQWSSNLEKDFDSEDLSQEISGADVDDADSNKVNLELTAEGFEGVSKQVEFPVYRFDSSPEELNFFYRNMLDKEFSIDVSETAENYNSVDENEFGFNDSDASKWFEMDPKGNTVSFKFEARPGGMSQGDKETVGIEFRDRKVKEFTVDYRNKFSGKVSDLAPSRVNTNFYLEGPNTQFSTDDSGKFEEFFSDSIADKMAFEFPKAYVEMSDFSFKFEDPRGQTNDIFYEYYSNFNELELDKKPEGLRPVNLVAFRSDYDFNQEESRVYIDFDGSQVNSVSDVEVWECEYWMFERERCAEDWNQKDPREDGQNRVSVSINPYSELFGGNVDVLWNSYIVGVPQGVGSSLTLQDKLDVSSTRLESGEELTVSGTVIDSSTGEPVSGADLELSLVSDGDTVDLDGESGSDGGFEFSTEIEEAGDYSVEFSAEKDPYDNFRKESSEKINVYYQTGLAVSTENEVEISTGDVSTIDFTVENTGQSEISDMELSVSGIDDRYYSLTPASLSSVGPGDSRTVEMRLDLPSDYCDGACDPPSITVDVSGSSAGEQLQNSASVYTSFPVDDEGTQDSQDSENSSSSSEKDSQSSMGVPGPDEVSKVTGNFVQSQSDMNLALGLILIFGMILAVTVRKRKDSDGDRENRMRGNGVSASAAGASGSSRVQRPDVSSSDKEEDSGNEDVEEEEETEEVQSEEEDDGSSESEAEEELVCDTCGEEFDTESGLNLHKDAFH